MKVGGRPDRSSARAGAAYWSALPSPRYHFQASMLPARSQSPMSVISWLDAGLVPVVDHRVDRHLEADRRAAAVAGEHRDGDGEAAARAAAVDGEAVRVETELGGVGAPSTPGRRSSPRPAPDTGARGPGGTRPRRPPRRRARRSRGDRVLAVDVPQDHAAAVDEVDPGQRPGGVDRPVDPHRDVRRALRAGHRPVLGGDVRIGRYLHGGQHLRSRSRGAATMSGMVLKPPGIACCSWSRGSRTSGSIRSRRDMNPPMAEDRCRMHPT